MSRPTKSTKPVVCEQCAGTDLVRRITTYPVRLTGPLEGKQIQVGRVALHRCLTCGYLMPIPAGQARWIVMSPWALACSSDNCPDPLRSPRGPLPVTHSAEAQQESSHCDFGELMRTRLSRYY